MWIVVRMHDDESKLYQSDLDLCLGHFLIL
jgi:hypothetical protein